MAQDKITRIRIALVLNGGVSLAVWMSGVVHELDLICRASQRDVAECDDSSDSAHFATWRRLLQDRHIEIVVDIIAGTSAGGLNGTILATALARDRYLPDLRDLWQRTAKLDAHHLLREPTDPDTTSILNGTFFADTVAVELNNIDGRPARTRADVTPTRPPAEVTLFVTATALGAAPVPYRDTARQPFDVTDHRRLYRFTKTNGTKFDIQRQTFVPDQRDDFGSPAGRGALACAARASASYPVAFTPVREGAQLASFRYPPTGSTAGEVETATSPPPKPGAFLVDGGVLDNAPIEPVIEEIARQSVDGTIRRVVAYVIPSNGVANLVPDPSHDGADPSGEPPPWWQVVGAAVDMPREADFRQDIAHLDEALGTRRARAETADALLRQARADSETRAALTTAARLLFDTYRHNRIETSVRAVRTALAERNLAARRLSSADAVIQDNSPTPWVTAADLDGPATQPWPFGFSGAQRSVRLLLRAVRHDIDTSEVESTPLDAAARALSDTKDYVAAIDAAVEERILERAPRDPDVTPTADAICLLVDDAFVAADAQARLGELVREAIGHYATVHPSDVDELYRLLLAIEVITGAAASRAESQAPPPFDFVRIGPDVDSALFPDMRKTGSDKLYGTSLGHFGAFGRAKWRRCDFTWGRLDVAAHVAKLLSTLPDSTPIDALALQTEVLTADKWSEQAEFEQAWTPAKGESFRQTVDSLRHDPEGQIGLTGVADAALEFLAHSYRQPGPSGRLTLISRFGQLVRGAFTERPWSPFGASCWSIGVRALATSRRRKFWRWLRGA